MSALPTGTITFLVTDVEGSTCLWEEQPASMRVALTRHDALIERAVLSDRWAVAAGYPMTAMNPAMKPSLSGPLKPEPIAQ
jgi:hypothetical protein